MDHSLIISLYQQNDKKRRRILYETFASQMQLKASLSFIAKFINQELGVEGLINEADIKYCRHYFMGKIKPSELLVPKRVPQKTVIEPLSNTPSEIVWTDPDDANYSPQKSNKTKFSK